MSLAPTGRIVKPFPKDRQEKETDPQKWALMLARELIASKFYQYLLGENGSPSYYFVKGAELSTHNVESDEVVNATDVAKAQEDDDFKVCKAAMELKKRTVATHFVLLAEIVAACYLLAEADFNLGGLLFMNDRADSTWKKIVKIDHDHSLMGWEYFPLPPSKGHDELIHYLYDIVPPIVPGCKFLNWAPTSDLNEVRKTLESKEEVDKATVEKANAAALRIFSEFGCLTEAEIKKMVESACPSELETHLPAETIQRFINKLSERAKKAREFVGPSAAAAASPDEGPCLSLTATEAASFNTDLCFCPVLSSGSSVSTPRTAASSASMSSPFTPFPY